MSELQIIDKKVGEGRAVEVGDTITVHYTGWLMDGKKFDSSTDHGQPFTTKIGIGMVIKGWDQGILGMKKGGVRELIIPSDLAYGANVVGDVIPSNATLKFEVELLGVN